MIVPNQTRDTLWLVNATRSYAGLASFRKRAREAEQLIHILHGPADREAIRQMLPAGDKFERLIEVSEDRAELPRVTDDAEVFFLACSDTIDWSALRRRPPLAHPDSIQLLFAEPPLISNSEHLASPVDWWGWRATGGLARRILREPSAWEDNAVGLIETIQRWPDPPRWLSTPLDLPGCDHYPISAPPVLTAASSVLAVLSFYRCEEWLHACLDSMTRQTRPPDNIVVVDDCSGAVPLDIVESFPSVTLLSMARNVGPENILNNILNTTQYDAYMVQDPDDWSAHDRLETTLRTAEQTGADMVGTHEFRIDLLKKELDLCVYPPDVNYALSLAIGHPLLHCTSLFSRRLALKIGGFNGQMKLAADTEFVTRGVHAGQIVNAPGICLFHRIRGQSITTHDKTGDSSATRLIEARYIRIRGWRNQERVRSGQAPRFVAPRMKPVDYIHHKGPKLRPNTDGGLA